MSLFIPALVARQGTSLINHVNNLGIASGLKMCLDAGDLNSYDGSSQTWIDQSGAGYSVYLGSGSSVDSADPAYNGIAGRQSASEYWTFNGTSSRFTLNQANPSWVNNLHKANAIWGFAAWLYVGSSLPSSAAVLFGTNASDNTHVGASAFVRSTGALRVTVTNGTSTVLLLTSTATVTTSAWNFLAGEINAGATTGSLTVNGTQEDEVTTYSSPSAGSATYQLEIAHDGVGSTGTGYIPSGYRLQNIALWETSKPTKANLLSLRSASIGKFS